MLRPKVQVVELTDTEIEKKLLESPRFVELVKTYAFQTRPAFKVAGSEMDRAESIAKRLGLI